MLLRNMGDFVRDDAGQFVFPLGGQQQAGVDADKIVRQGEGVDGGAANRKKVERRAVLVGVGHDALADGIEVGGQLHVIQNHVALAQLAHHLQPHAPLLIGTEIGFGRIAHVRQIQRLRPQRSGGSPTEQ